MSSETRFPTNSANILLHIVSFFYNFYTNINTFLYFYGKKLGMKMNFFVILYRPSQSKGRTVKSSWNPEAEDTVCKDSQRGKAVFETKQTSTPFSFPNLNISIYAELGSKEAT